MALLLDELFNAAEANVTDQESEVVNIADDTEQVGIEVLSQDFALAICKRTFDVLDIPATNPSYGPRMNIANQLQPLVRNCMRPIFTRNKDAYQDILAVVDKYANKLSSYLYHGSFFFSGPVSEDSFGSAAISIAWNVRTLFGGKHHFYSPRAYTQHEVDRDMRDLTSAAITEVTQSINR